MSRVGTGSVGRSVRGLTLDIERRRKRVQEQRDLEGLLEREEQVKVDVSGNAEEFPVWQQIHLPFTTVFIDASGQRNTEFDRPHFTYGGVVLNGGPIGLLACITRWDVNDRNETVGCMLAIGAVATDRARKFRGELHARFQGFGAPEDVYGSLGEQLDIG